MKSLLSSLLILIAACANTGVTRVRPAEPRPEGCRLDLYTAETEVKRPFEVACLIDATSGGTLFDDRTAAGAIAAARPDACRCGADGMIVMSAQTKGYDGKSYGEGSVVLRAIRYTAAAPVEAAAAPAAPAGPAAGTERGACYGNGTCNAGLTCASNLCVMLPAPAPTPAP